MLPTKEIFDILSGLVGRVGVYLEDLESGEVFAINPELVFPSASTIKIPIHAVILMNVEAGRLSLSDIADITPSNRVGGTGVLKELNPNIRLTIKDLATLMIILSDNIATNQLIDLAGMDRVNAFCKDLGMNNTVLQRKMMDLEAARAGRDNFTTAGDMGLLLKLLAEGKVVSTEVSDAIVDTMKCQLLRNKLPALLPAVPAYAPTSDQDKVAPGTVVVANKTGDLFHLQHDVGILYLPDKTYVLAILTDKLSSDAAGVRAINKISLAVYNALANESDSLS